MSEAFIEEMGQLVDWRQVSIHQTLSEAFIERHADRIDWYCISNYGDMSEEFMERHANQLDWGLISQMQTMSMEFMWRNRDRITVCDNVRRCVWIARVARAFTGLPDDVIRHICQFVQN